jgi:hypothetical protein
MTTARVRSTLTALALALGVAGGILVDSADARAAALACEDPSNLCADGGTFAAGKQTPAKERKKRVEKSGATVSLTIDNGRGSLFVNGRYAGTAPLSSVPIAAGKNDIQVRDGVTVIASGTLVVGKGASVTLTAKHP